MKREELLPYVAAIVDDAGGVVYRNDQSASFHLTDIEDCVLVGYQQGCEPTVWAARSAVCAELDPDEAEDLVQEYLVEKGWFSDGPTVADFVVACD
jgi:hypothetical protein